jgi:hypothetical protein
VVVAETLLLYFRTSESDISSFVEQVLGILERLLHIFFNKRHRVWSAVADIGGEHRFSSKEQEE